MRMHTIHILEGERFHHVTIHRHLSGGKTVTVYQGFVNVDIHASGTAEQVLADVCTHITGAMWNRMATPQK